MAARSKALACGRSPAEILGSNPTGGMDICCECRLLSGRGLCDELITRPEESYRLCCVVVCDLETSRIGTPYIYDISSLRVKLKIGRNCDTYFTACRPTSQGPQSVSGCLEKEKNLDPNQELSPDYQAVYTVV